MYQIDMKFDRQLRPATETSRVVSYGGKTIPRWRTAAILKIDISPYLSEKKTSDFHEILYTAADFDLDERHVIKNEKVALDRLPFDRTYFLFRKQSFSYFILIHCIVMSSSQCARKLRFYTVWSACTQGRKTYMYTKPVRIGYGIC